ncbi:MAG: hypothetical protein ACXVCK_09845 [Bdellovibrionota bacterium]
MPDPRGPGAMSGVALALFFLASALAHADDELYHSPEPADCGHMEVWDPIVGMCAPFPMAGMPMKMLMVHGNSFFTQVVEEKPRGRSAFAVPDMFMADLGTSLGDRHYLNLDFMGTVEKWTLPQSGYPEFLQIGENDASGRPFVDAQHPHSSPVMGLTLSDTIALGADKDHAKVWFAPRGESTDGPVAFMHRPTGMVNPDAPLGHHIGQDVGHISSTVVGASLHFDRSTFELSTFHGEEPQPTKVDLPVGTPDSYAGRYIFQFHEHLFAMGSAAFVNKPEPTDSDLDHVWRFSASVYHDKQFESGWNVHSALIWGTIKNYDHAASLTSFAGEAWAERNADNLWTRLEVLQRTPAELLIGTSNQGRWVTVPTLGYTRKIARWEDAALGLGGSLTKDFLPGEIRAAYGGDPWTGKIFLQLSGMKMWDL